MRWVPPPWLGCFQRMKGEGELSLSAAAEIGAVTALGHSLLHGDAF